MPDNRSSHRSPANPMRKGCAATPRDLSDRLWVETAVSIFGRQATANNGSSKSLTFSRLKPSPPESPTTRQNQPLPTADRSSSTVGVRNRGPEKGYRRRARSRVIQPVNRSSVSRQLSKLCGQIARKGTGPAISDLAAVDFDNGHDLGRASGEKTLIADVNVVLR